MNLKKTTSMKKKLLSALLSIAMYGVSFSQIGINNTDPKATLDITARGSTFNTKSFRIVNAATTETVTVLDNGSVGINNATPASTLDVIGSARVSARAGTGDTVLGVVSSTGQLTDMTIGAGLSVVGGQLIASSKSAASLRSTVSSQTVTGTVPVAINFNIEDADVNNNYDTTTNLFTPTKTSAYTVIVPIRIQSQTTTTESLSVGLYKDGILVGNTQSFSTNLTPNSTSIYFVATLMAGSNYDIRMNSSGPGSKTIDSNSTFAIFTEL